MIPYFLKKTLAGDINSLNLLVSSAVVCLKLYLLAAIHAPISFISEPLLLVHVNCDKS